MAKLTQKTLKERLYYDPATGIFTRIATPAYKAALLIGKRAGTLNAIGYRQISIDRVLYLEHRLAWLYMTGEWPIGVDHINMNRDDNRWCNLRHATKAENNCNRLRQANNISGYKGVSPFGKRWRATIGNGGKQIHLGLFDSPLEAYRVYARAAQEIHGAFARSP